MLQVRYFLCIRLNLNIDFKKYFRYIELSCILEKCNERFAVFYLDKITNGNEVTNGYVSIVFKPK